MQHRVAQIVSLALFLGILEFVGAQDRPRESGFPRGYFSGDPLPPSTIYLTFDDGPAPETEGVLKILEDKGVRATFFINAFNRKAPADRIGKENNLLRYKDVLQRMVADGDVIGNHTFSHRDLATLTASQIEWQLDTVQKDLDEALVDAPRLKLIRAPFGSPWLGHWATLEQRQTVAGVAEKRGLVMGWTAAWDSSDSIDWVSGENQRMTAVQFVPPPVYIKKEDREIQRLLAHADGKESAVVLLHDTHPTTLDVLGPVIDKYKALGYTFSTLDEYSKWRWGETAFDSLK